MTKGTRIYLGTLAGAIVCAAILGGMTRFSFQGSTTMEELKDSSDIDGYTIQISDADSQDGIFANVSNYHELEKNSELIAKVRVTNDRKLYSSAIETKVILEEIYKSNIELNRNDTIYIYEPADFEEAFGIYDSVGGYQLMESKEEYYVCLNGLKTAPGYQKSDKEKVTFVPSTTKFSVFRIDDKKQQVLNQKKLDGEEGQYCYGEIKNLSIITSNKNEVEMYHNIKMELMSRKNE